MKTAFCVAVIFGMFFCLIQSANAENQEQEVVRELEDLMTRVLLEQEFAKRQSCSDVLSAEECATYMGFGEGACDHPEMKANCKSSCGLCTKKRQSCSDLLSAEDCATYMGYGEGACEHPEMKANCKSSCGLCKRQSCSDVLSAEDCTKYMSYGEGACDHPEMKANCKSSCGLC